MKTKMTTGHIFANEQEARIFAAANDIPAMPASREMEIAAALLNLPTTKDLFDLLVQTNLMLRVDFMCNPRVGCDNYTPKVIYGACNSSLVDWYVKEGKIQKHGLPDREWVTPVKPLQNPVMFRLTLGKAAMASIVLAKFNYSPAVLRELGPFMSAAEKETYKLQHELVSYMCFSEAEISRLKISKKKCEDEINELKGLAANNMVCVN